MSRKTRLSRAEKQEKRYGDPYLKKLVQEEPSLGYLYDNFVHLGSNCMYDLATATIYIVFGILWWVVAVFREPESGGDRAFASGVLFMALGFYWLSEFHRENDKRYHTCLRLMDEWERKKWRKLNSEVADELRKKVGKRKVQKNGNDD